MGLGLQLHPWGAVGLILPPLLLIKMGSQIMPLSGSMRNYHLKKFCCWFVTYCLSQRDATED